MAEITVPIWRVADAPQSPTELPRYATEGSAGCDLGAAITEPLAIPPGGRALVRTGFAIALPAGYEGQIRPRSGLAAREGVTVINAPGTIDSDYRGEICVALVNLGSEQRVIEPGQRIAQLVVAPVTRVSWAECDGDEARQALATARGTGGFGHTGKTSPSDPRRRSRDDERGSSR